MRPLLITLFLAFPLTIFGGYIEGHFISPAQVIIVIVAAVALHRVLTDGSWGGWAQRHIWAYPFGLFILSGMLSTALSPYLSNVFSKAFFQIAGIGIVVLSGMAIVEELRRRPMFLVALARCLSATLGVAAVIGILQFLDFNGFGNTGFLDFSYMNDFYAGGIVWKYPGELGGVSRINSIFGEPAQMARYLGVCTGIALLRLRVLGKRHADALRDVIPAWSACAVLVAGLLSLSVLAYAFLVITLVSLLLVSRRGSFLKTALMAVILTGTLITLVQLLSPELSEKAFTIEEVFSAGPDVIDEAGYESSKLSALSIRVNYEVMKMNLERSPMFGIGLGGHPTSYRRGAPTAEGVYEDLEALNSEDAASLWVRLLSETGILGMCLYVLGMLAILLASRRALLLCGDDLAKKAEPSMGVRHAISIGVAGSCVGECAIYLFRQGQYYELPLWISLVLTAAIPYVLASRRIRRKG